MKPTEYMSGNFQEVPLQKAVEGQNTTESMDSREKDARMRFDEIFEKICKESASDEEKKDALYIARENAFNAREYGVHSKIMDEIERLEERELPA